MRNLARTRAHTPPLSRSVLILRFTDRYVSAAIVCIGFHREVALDGGGWDSTGRCPTLWVRRGAHTKTTERTKQAPTFAAGVRGGSVVVRLAAGDAQRATGKRMACDVQRATHEMACLPAPIATRIRGLQLQRDRRARRAVPARSPRLPRALAHQGALPRASAPPPRSRPRRIGCIERRLYCPAFGPARAASDTARGRKTHGFLWRSRRSGPAPAARGQRTLSPPSPTSPHGRFSGRGRAEARKQTHQPNPQVEFVGSATPRDGASGALSLVSQLSSSFKFGRVCIRRHTNKQTHRPRHAARRAMCAALCAFDGQHGRAALTRESCAARRSVCLSFACLFVRRRSASAPSAAAVGDAASPRNRCVVCCSGPQWSVARCLPAVRIVAPE